MTNVQIAGIFEVTLFPHVKVYDRLLANFGWMHLKLNLRSAVRTTRIYEQRWPDGCFCVLNLLHMLVL